MSQSLGNSIVQQLERDALTARDVAARYTHRALKQLTSKALVQLERDTREAHQQLERLAPHSDAALRVWSHRVNKVRLALLDLNEPRREAMPATYQRAVLWIAQYEQHSEHNPLMQKGEPLDRAIVATYQSVALVADVFGRDSDIVVHDVVRAYARLQHAPTSEIISVAAARRAAR